MERRLHTRHRARTTVYINIPGGRRKLCRAVNLSATGVFIETTNLGLRKGQQVELAFAINLGAITKLHRRTAVVAHVSRGGTGLLMEAYSARPTQLLTRADHSVFARDTRKRQCRLGWCRLQESNPRHPVYKTGALPTELSRHRMGRRF